jgi:hypothetical protein
MHLAIHTKHRETVAGCLQEEPQMRKCGWNS